MKLLFKQRLFSWFDSYDIYAENGQVLYTVQGRLSWGHCLEIYTPQGEHVGTVKEEVFTFLPRFRMYLHGQYIGQICKEFTLFRPSFHLDCNGWRVTGDFLEWDYAVQNNTGAPIGFVSKQIFNFTDTYSIDVHNPQDSIVLLMIALAIDAAKCSANS